MVQETKGTDKATEVVVKTEADLLQEMDAAMKSKDFKAVAKVSNELVKFQKEREGAELQAKQKALEAITESVKGYFSAIGQLLTSGHKATAKELEATGKQLANIKGTELDQADGIWFANDFGEKLVTIRLMKGQAKATRTASAGGTGKKFAVSTDELLAKFGNEVYKDNVNYAEAYKGNTDKNYRYQIRESLLKKGGYIS